MSSLVIPVEAILFLVSVGRQFLLLLAAISPTMKNFAIKNSVQFGDLSNQI